jgi:hypothetical protein
MEERGPRTPMKPDEIREHWERAGRIFPTNQVVTPTSRDPCLAMLEGENILRPLSPDAIVLERDCGEGAHSVDMLGK